MPQKNKYENILVYTKENFRFTTDYKSDIIKSECEGDLSENLFASQNIQRIRG